MNLNKASRSRQLLLDSTQALELCAKEVVTERGPLLKGYYQPRGTRCGKDNCKCNQGELHSTAVLIVVQDGKRRSYYVRPPERPEVQRRVQRYQRLRERQSEMRKLNEQAQAALDDLLDALTEPHQPQRRRTSAQTSGRRTRRRANH